MTKPTTLIDTGPLVALVDKGQGEAHRLYKEALRTSERPLLSTWPCLTEALYFLHELRGWEGQQALWALIEKDVIRVHHPAAEELRRAAALMEQYQDTPMDFADASLVVLAERTGLRRILTLDRDFYIYQLPGKNVFEVIRLGIA